MLPHKFIAMETINNYSCPGRNEALIKRMIENKSPSLNSITKLVLLELTKYYVSNHVGSVIFQWWGERIMYPMTKTFG